MLAVSERKLAFFWKELQIRGTVASGFAPIGRHRHKGDLKPEYFVISGLGIQRINT